MTRGAIDHQHSPCGQRRVASNRVAVSQKSGCVAIERSPGHPYGLLSGESEISERFHLRIIRTFVHKFSGVESWFSYFVAAEKFASL